MSVAAAVILAFSIATLLASWAYFRRHAIARPPIGVLGLEDVAALLIGVVLMPYLYLSLPDGLAVGLLGLGLLNVLATAVQAIVPDRWLAWLAALVALGASLGAIVAAGPSSPVFF